jgi:hypothetical protein
MEVLFQVIYCVKTRHSRAPWWQNWYLLQCPLVGINSLAQARQMAKEWKVQLGVKFQLIIIGETDGDYERVWIDMLFGVNAINGLDALHEDLPGFLLEEDKEKGECVSDD